MNLDVETSPAKAYIWELKTRYVPASQLIEPKRLLCFAAKWVGEPHKFFYSRWHDGQDRMVHRIVDLLNDADAVLHYNGKRFDEPVINSEIALLQIRPPAPYKRVDLYQAVRGKFDLMSYSLNYVSRFFGTDGKLTHEGFQLWVKVLNGDVEARKQMRLYNLGDIDANESLYNRVLPWIDQHPNQAVFSGEDCCPACGGYGLQRRGYAHTQVRTYQRFVCVTCGKWSKSGKSVSGVSIREVAA